MKLERGVSLKCLIAELGVGVPAMYFPRTNNLPY
jgi:hypothetical protein